MSDDSPIPLHKDKVRLIDVYFGISIAIGLEQFAIFFISDKVTMNLQYGDVFNIAFFISAFFFLISDWISYHINISDQQYKKWSRFGLDLLIVSIMFLILFISLSAFDKITYFIASLLAWGSLIWGWYFNRYRTKKNENEEIKKSKKNNDEEIKKSKKNLVIYGMFIAVLLALFLLFLGLPVDTLHMNHPHFNLENVLKILVMFVVIGFSIIKLKQAFKDEAKRKSKTCIKE